MLACVKEKTFQKTNLFWQANKLPTFSLYLV